MAGVSAVFTSMHRPQEYLSPFLDSYLLLLSFEGIFLSIKYFKVDSFCNCIGIKLSQLNMAVVLHHQQSACVLA
jgi:hypothetical protein